uniref:uncharacterized protein LOC124001980 isoform X2 n=1 Tax=Oncorhynchus gorbuscha TaxID=8017 RepID=UPI001EAF1386|nr:uncharacterized protein LOC124001980 isoform X2 [Oncorhynchus gorbuscha]
MQLLFLLLCLFVKPAFLQGSQRAKLIFQIGAPVMPAGQTVKMFCMVSFVVNKYSWYRLNQTTSTAMNINNNSLTLIVTTKDSGEYKCSGYYNGTRYESNAVNLTVVERLSNVLVSSTPKDLVTMEGQSVTLYCQATSHPPSVIWSWSRLDEQGGWQEVDMGRELTLSMASESGQYFCQAYSNISSLTQQQQSPSHTVYIVYFPMTVCMQEWQGWCWFSLPGSYRPCCCCGSGGSGPKRRPVKRPWPPIVHRPKDILDLQKHQRGRVRPRLGMREKST